MSSHVVDIAFDSIGDVFGKDAMRGGRERKMATL
jgi:hypothetical protein